MPVNDELARYSKFEDGMKAIIRKRVHSKFWHMNRVKFVNHGMSDAEAKERASEEAGRAIACWLKLVG